MNWIAFWSAAAGSFIGLLVGIGICGFLCWWNLYREHDDSAP